MAQCAADEQASRAALKAKEVGILKKFAQSPDKPVKSMRPRSPAFRASNYTAKLFRTIEIFRKQAKIMNTHRIDESAWNYAYFAIESMIQDGRWLLENHIQCGHHSKHTPTLVSDLPNCRDSPRKLKTRKHGKHHLEVRRI